MLPRLRPPAVPPPVLTVIAVVVVLGAAVLLSVSRGSPGTAVAECDGYLTGASARARSGAGEWPDIRAEAAADALVCGGAIAAARNVRRGAYRAVLSGATGRTHRPAGSGQPAFRGARAGVDASMATQLGHARALAESRPRTAPADVVIGAGGGAGRVQAAMAADGSTLIAYTPVGDPVTVDLGGLAGDTARPWWFDPRTGLAVELDAQTGGAITTFTPPAGGGDTADWVLVVDDAAAGYGPPGRREEGEHDGPERSVAPAPASPAPAPPQALPAPSPATPPTLSSAPPLPAPPLPLAPPPLAPPPSPPPLLSPPLPLAPRLPAPRLPAPPLPAPPLPAPPPAPPSPDRPSAIAPAAPEPPPRPAQRHPAPSPAGALVWDRLARCESSGDWAIDTGNGYYGGLQFDADTWRAYGGTAFAPSAHRATREQQITVAVRVRDDRGGYGSWPACARKLGLPP